MDARMKTSRRQLEDRITYLQLTLAALNEQLEAQNHPVIGTADETGTRSGGQGAGAEPSSETPLPIAAG